jgi:hypothetical protein
MASSGTILEQQDREGAPAIGRVHVAAILEDLYGKGGRGQREPEARDQRSLPGKQAGEISQARQHGARQDDLRTAEAEDVLAHLPQACRLQFQADDEEQQHDAELGDGQDLFAAADQPADRADDDAGRDIAEHRAEPQPLEERCRDDGAAEQQKCFVEQGMR